MCVSSFNHFHNFFASKSQRREVLIGEAFNVMQEEETSVVLSQKAKPMWCNCYFFALQLELPTCLIYVIYTHKTSSHTVRGHKNHVEIHLLPGDYVKA